MASATVTPPRPVVSFRNVDIVFGPEPARALALVDQGRSRDEIARETGQIVGVKHATLDVDQGEVVVLMGLSGSGKSTLLRAVNGLTRVSRGSLLVFDGEGEVDVTSCPARQLRQLRRHRVAMVFQQFALLPWRSVAENVALGLELDGVGRAQRGERVAEQLELVGLTGWGDKRVEELSGGMQQRVGLARAFATSAPLLLMDEPFSALDPLIRVRLQDELLALQRKLSRTIIFVSHDLDEALRIGTRIAIMEGGEIVQIGTPQEIVLDPCSDYVRDFVAHMNPLNVLRAREVMAAPGPQTPGPESSGPESSGPESPGPQTPGRAAGDDRPAVRVDAAGQGWIGPDKVPVVALERIAEAPRRAIIAVVPEVPLRALIAARVAHGGPFAVMENDALAGVIGDCDLFGCMVQARAAPGRTPGPVSAERSAADPAAGSAERPAEGPAEGPAAATGAARHEPAH